MPQFAAVPIMFIVCGQTVHKPLKNRPLLSRPKSIWQRPRQQRPRQQRPHRTQMNLSTGDDVNQSQDGRKWKCMEHCGACCKLDDFDPDVLREMLSSEQDVVEYLSMIRPDGWCKHFDSFSRKCTIYESRPEFCRATPQVFEQLYNVSPPQFDQFAIACCEFHIANTFGERSNEASRYEAFK